MRLGKCLYVYGNALVPLCPSRRHRRLLSVRPSHRTSHRRLSSVRPSRHVHPVVAVVVVLLCPSVRPIVRPACRRRRPFSVRPSRRPSNYNLRNCA